MIKHTNVNQKPNVHLDPENLDAEEWFLFRGSFLVEALIIHKRSPVAHRGAPDNTQLPIIWNHESSIRE